MAFPIPIIGNIIDKVGDIAGQLITDKDKQIQLKVDLERLKLEEAGKAEDRLHQQMMGQIEVNKVEAASESVWVSGWRPAVGWISAAGVGYSFVLEPIMSWGARVLFKYGGSFPSLNYSELMILVTGMLGFGALRTYEKNSGVATAPPDDGGPSKVTPAVGIPVEQLNMDPKTGRIKGAPPWQR